MEKIFFKCPHIIQEFLITLFNLRAYRTRYGKFYKNYLKEYSQNRNLSLEALLKIQDEKLVELFNYAKTNSKFYNNLYKENNMELRSAANGLKHLRIIDKELLRKNIENIYTIGKDKGLLSKTGGTTGKSLEVLYTKKNIQERFAILDTFRNSQYYKLGKKTAWFSGKNLLTEKDINKNRFWK